MTVLNKTAPNNHTKSFRNGNISSKCTSKVSSLLKKIQFTIDKFASRKDFENKEILNIQNIYNNKPGDNYNIEEEVLVENTRDSIGYLTLKPGSNSKVTENKILNFNNFNGKYI